MPLTTYLKAVMVDILVPSTMLKSSPAVRSEAFRSRAVS